MKSLFFVVTLTLTCLVSHAQTLYPRLGITASINTYGEPSQEMEPRIGFTAGLGYNLSVSNSISLQAELNYIQKSFKSQSSSSTSIQYGDDIYVLQEKESDQYTFSYLELPLLLKARLLHDNVFVLGGLSIGMGLGGSHKYTYESTSSYLDPVYEEGSGKIKFGDSSSTNGEDVYFDNRWDVGLHVGIGALIAKKIQIECRYGFGTINLNDDTDSKSRCLQISFSTPIELKR
ncbi:MAG TPA: outer membrane beta-barrel protein [Chryseolinea sp.]|nr:outer membrane beta-barrel protein [Chryseolinea sp.]